MADSEAEAQSQKQDGHRGQNEIDLRVALVDVFSAFGDLKSEIIKSNTILINLVSHKSFVKP